MVPHLAVLQILSRVHDIQIVSHQQRDGSIINFAESVIGKESLFQDGNKDDMGNSVEWKVSGERNPELIYKIQFGCTRFI